MPLDQIQLGSAEPFFLPWIGQWVGPMKALIFLAKLEESRDTGPSNVTVRRLPLQDRSRIRLKVEEILQVPSEMGTLASGLQGSEIDEEEL